MVTTAPETHGTDAPAAAEAAWSGGALTVRDARVFGPGGAGAGLAHAFLRRAFAVPGVRSVTMDRSRGEAVVRLDPGADAGRLASSVRGEGDLEPLDPGEVPRPPDEPPRVTVRRHGPVLTTWDVRLIGPGLLRLRHSAAPRGSAAARRAGDDLGRVAGVRSARFDRWLGGLLVTYDPSAVADADLVRRAEAALAAPAPATGRGAGKVPARFGLENASLGLAAVGDLALPLLSPVSAVLLVGTNVGTFRRAAGQLRRGEIGLPVLYTAIVGTSLLSGQFLASAAMTWMFRYWHERSGDDLARERVRLLVEARAPSPPACLVSCDGSVEALPPARLRPGDVVVVSAGEVIPADGRVLQGGGILDERGLAWGEGVAAKGPGDRAQAGARVIAGRLALAVERAGSATRAASVGRALEAATRFPAERPADALAGRAVGPTLATAGLGLLVGGLATAGAVLRPDYATGPGLAVPFESLRDLAAGLRRGLLIRDPTVLGRLAGVDLIVLDDGPALRRHGLDLALIQTPMPESDDLLRFAAGAARHLADDRASALLAACRERGLTVPRLDLESADLSRGLTARSDRRRVRLHDLPVDDGGPGPAPTPPLAVEIDGVAAGVFRFRRARRPEAAGSVARLRSVTKARIVLLSDRPERDAAALAAALGVDSHAASLAPADKARYLLDGRARGARLAWVGDARANPGLALACDASVSLAADPDPATDPAAVVLLGPRLAPLADLWSIAVAHAGRLRDARRMVLLPNLLCVAGAFTFGFTSLTAVVLSNLGTFGVYSRALAPFSGPALPDPDRDPDRDHFLEPDAPGATRATRPA